MTDKDKLERLSWQLERETGLRAQMTERMETAEKVAGGLREELRVASHNLRELACRDNSVVTALRAKSKQQLADSLTAENATLARLEKAERELEDALTMKRTALDKCTSLTKERDEARLDGERQHDDAVKRAKMVREELELRENTERERDTAIAALTAANVEVERLVKQIKYLHR